MKHHARHRNRVRISGGSHRGSILTFDDADGLRPTPDMVRQKLFNWLGQELHGQNVLDLFAGSGALGLEAASRHAARVCLCDHNRRTVAALHDNIRRLGLAQAHAVHSEALAFLHTNRQRFDLVLLDPPFAWRGWQALFDALRPHLADGARVYAEAAQLPDFPEWLLPHRESRAGQSRFVLLRRA
ncbi:16S rRNA (guanine(966)-N(2))-methyltransferase RsmD [Conchiformibius kuhniae]|uniref:16S rRNA (Guanine(966)-N(2))-methyltransferase RsmD n=1 Tax=Conchiformibius kuhniae TaxID=211502 RepID=A0A8T9MTA9_9NEIS|nr:16S rRNA (guanine(966)-N(2))-methyltransferase RsmD [Conchiformibius kuhniae]UOP04324.1 16S rRNA (guanine(966)-N(2))-methyltransferase RsmD [Conchiformibius kuhniae]